MLGSERGDPSELLHQANVITGRGCGIKGAFCTGALLYCTRCSVFGRIWDEQ